MANTNITIRIDDGLKKRAEELFSDLGLNMTTAINAFIKQAVREQGIPFTISRNVPNSDTLAAVEERKKMKENPDDYKGYDDVDTMFKEILG